MRRFSWKPIVSVIVAGAIHASAAPPATPDGTLFPTPEALEGHVAFWTTIFAEQDVDRVIVHDLDDPMLVYEVFVLPGEKKDSYTEAQEELVEARRESWEKRLKTLEMAIKTGQSLSDQQKELALRISTTIGSDRIQDAHSRVRTQRGLRSRFKRGLELGNRYDAVIRSILKEAGLPEALVYLPHVESSYQPAARSSAGAAGIWQFTRSTGKAFLKINSAIDERLDPLAATRGAARYLADAYQRLGSWPLAITSYNHGVNGMDRARAQFGDDLGEIVYNYRSRYFGFASKNFYAEFLAAREIAENPARYFPEGLHPAAPLSEENLALKHSTPAARLARQYGVPLKELVSLNPAWTRRTIYGNLRVSKGTIVRLPAGALERFASGNVPEVDLTPPGPPPDTYHRVARGENLSVIARRYGISLAALRRMNGMDRRDSTIYPGEKLRVFLPHAAAPSIHRVARGETLSQIARRYKVPLDDLLRRNRLTLRSVIHPGQTIKLR